MATPWSNSTSYSPGAVVSYKGLEYIRSQYPDTATSGTAPNVETSVDPNGDTIRTWRLNTPLNNPSPLLTLYFRTQYPPVEDDGDFAYSFPGGQSFQVNAYDYDPFAPPDQYSIGSSSEWDQATGSTPVCAANSCGVAMQQSPESIIYVQANGLGATRTKYIYLTFNHPLYFRRTITVMTIIQVTTTPKDPPGSPTTTYQITNTPVIPDDRSYCSDSLESSYYVPANSVFSVTVPEDEDGEEFSVEYAFGGAAVVGVSAGD
jgi:hypothetical protein